MRKIWLLCLFVLTACAGPFRATPLPTPEVIHAAISPALRPLAEALHTCAGAYPGFVINLDEIPASSMDLQSADVSIRLGGKLANGFAAPLYEETIALIVNSDNPVLDIPTEQIGAIFTGRITSWAEAGGESHPIQVWSYAEGDDAREILDAALFPGENLTPSALIAPDPQAMLESVKDDPLAIGYVPQTWLAQAKTAGLVRPLQINEKLVRVLHQPVLAFSRTEPEGMLRQLLICLQSAGR